MEPSARCDSPDRAVIAQWQDAELAMTVARRCWEGWRQAGQQDLDTSTATRHAYHTHEALHEAARAIALLIETRPGRGDDTGCPPRSTPGGSRRGLSGCRP